MGHTLTMLKNMSWNSESEHSSLKPVFSGCVYCHVLLMVFCVQLCKIGFPTGTSLAAEKRAYNKRLKPLFYCTFTLRFWLSPQPQPLSNLFLAMLMVCVWQCWSVGESVSHWVRLPLWSKSKYPINYWMDCHDDLKESSFQVFSTMSNTRRFTMVMLYLQNISISSLAINSINCA